MPKCEKCNTQTDTMYMNLCEKCHAFSVFDDNKPTNEVIERVKSNNCIPCGNSFLYPVQHKANCTYCQLVKKHYSDYQKQKA